MEMREYFLLVIHAGLFIGGVSVMHNCPRRNLDFGQIKRAGKKPNKRTNKIKTDYGEQANSSFTIFSPKKKALLDQFLNPFLLYSLSYSLMLPQLSTPDIPPSPSPRLAGAPVCHHLSGLLSCLKSRSDVWQSWCATYEDTFLAHSGPDTTLILQDHQQLTHIIL